MLEELENKLTGILFGFYTVYWAIQLRFEVDEPYADVGDFWEEINIGYYVINGKSK